MVKTFNQNCITCLDNPSVYAFHLCGHQCLCEHCYQEKMTLVCYNARFFAQAHEKTVTDETERVKRLAYHRMQMLQILEKKKKERMQKEFISEDFKPSQQTVMDFSELQEEVALYTEDELAWELEQLNSFERTILREVRTPSSQQSD